MNEQIQILLSHFYSYAKNKLGFDKDASIRFVTDDENSKNPLGTTAHYNPGSMDVTVYISGRHPKDILRSVAHELVHHKQNCDGKMQNLNPTTPGYAQEDSHLRGLEEEAYLEGNMCFRDWEDEYKSNQEVRTIYESVTTKFIKEKLQMSTKNELRNIVKEAVTKVLSENRLKEMDFGYDEDDPDAAYFAQLEKEFPFLKKDAEMGGSAPADVQRSMDDEMPAAMGDEDEDEMMEGMCASCGVSPCGCPMEEKNVSEAADPVGPVEAQKCAELLKNLGFTLTRGGMNSLADFLESLEQRGDINATPDSRRGALAEDASDETFDMVDMIADALGHKNALEAVVQAMSQDDARSTLSYIIQQYDLGTYDDKIVKEKTTDKHDDNPALTGDQKDELPDHLQKAIIDAEEEVDEEKLSPLQRDLKRRQAMKDAHDDRLRKEFPDLSDYERGSAQYKKEAVEDDITSSEDRYGDMRHILTKMEFTGNIENDVREMEQDEELADWLYGELGSNDVITDKFGTEPGQSTEYSGADVQDYLNTDDVELPDIAETQEDFYAQMRTDARTLSEDWNKNVRNKRSALLNERLMKAWKLG